MADSLRRMRGALAVLLASVFVGLGFYMPTSSASAVVPLLAPAPCVGSSLCSPQAPAILAELAAQGGASGALTTSGVALTTSEATAFAGIIQANGLGVASAGSVATAASAGGGGGLLTGAAAALGLGGVLAWAATVNSGAVASLPPAGGGTTAGGFGARSFSIGGISGTWAGSGWVVGSTSATATVTVSLASDPVTTVRIRANCGNGTDVQATSLSGWQAVSPTGPHTTVGVAPSTLCAGAGGFTGVLKITTGAAPGTLRDSLAVPQTTTSGGRTIQQTVTCSNPSGATTTVTNSTSLPSSGNVGVAGLNCPTGTRASSWAVKVIGTGVPDVDVGTSTVPQPNADCGFVGGTQCVLQLQVNVATATAPTWRSCHSTDLAFACTDFWTDPARDLKFRCVYGPLTGGSVTVVGMGACSIYRASFPRNATETPPVISEPIPAADPADGTGSCDLGWGDLLNGTIVFKAVGCALEWAFVPGSGVVTAETTEMQAAWESSALGTFVGSSLDLFAPLTDLSAADASTCGGLAVTIPLPGLPLDMSFLDACEEPWDAIAPWSRGLLTAFIIGGGAYMLVRVLGAGLGWQLPSRSGAPE